MENLSIVPTFDLILDSNNQSYVGVGSRKTPTPICHLMTALGYKLATKNMLLRSGGVILADTAFETGCNQAKGAMEIFYTHDYKWSCNDGIKRRLYKRNYNKQNWQEAKLIASQFHPAWQYLNDYSKKLHTRNVFQVLGYDLQSVAQFLICWTPDGAKTKEQTSKHTGGTGQAIRIASSYGVRIYNLAVKEDFELANNWVK